MGSRERELYRKILLKFINDHLKFMGSGTKAKIKYEIMVGTDDGISWRTRSRGVILNHGKTVDEPHHSSPPSSTQ
jgi:hypothetical protein